jgi:hypothetical protein
MSENWGLCKACKWWQIEEEQTAADRTTGYCGEETLAPYQLSVTGHCGCSLFVEGKVGREAGASRQPPLVAAPARAAPIFLQRVPPRKG